MDTVIWDHYYDVVKRVSSLAGQWPYQRARTRLLCVSLVTVSIFSLNVPQMKDLADHLFNDWNALETSEEYKIMMKYAKNSRRYSLGYSLYCFVALFLFLSMSLIPSLLDIALPLNKSRPILLTYPGYYFVDEKEYFFYTFIHAIIAWEIALTGLVAHDCIFLTYVEHVCSMFAVVGFRFERLFYNSTNEVRTIDINNTNNDISCKRVMFIVHAHQEAIRYAQLLEDAFCISFAIQLLIATLVMSITMLQIVQQKDDSNNLETMRYALYIAGELMHLFFLSFEGQKLIDHSLQIRHKIYNSCWYEVSIKSQKLIILIMIKSLRLNFLSAGKIYIFSLESFTTILQSSMSYCAVLASLQ